MTKVKCVIYIWQRVGILHGNLDEVLIVDIEPPSVVLFFIQNHTGYPKLTDGSIMSLANILSTSI